MKLLGWSVGGLCVLVAGWITVAPVWGAWPAKMTAGAPSVTNTASVTSVPSIGTVGTLNRSLGACLTPDVWLALQKAYKAGDETGVDELHNAKLVVPLAEAE